MNIFAGRTKEYQGQQEKLRQETCDHDWAVSVIAYEGPDERYGYECDLCGKIDNESPIDEDDPLDWDYIYFID